jgi:hypothetical protein
LLRRRGDDSVPLLARTQIFDVPPRRCRPGGYAVGSVPTGAREHSASSRRRRGEVATTTSDDTKREQISGGVTTFTSRRIDVAAATGQETGMCAGKPPDGAHTMGNRRRTL